VAGYNITNHFYNLLTYQFPFGKGRHFLNRTGPLNWVLDGWSATSMLELESGTPFSVTYAGSPYRYLSQGISRPNILVPNDQALTPNWNIGPNRFPTSAQNPYLKFSAFEYPAPFTTGPLGRNTFEGPGMFWQQLGLAKTFSVREPLKITLRAEGNNFPFKHPELLLPNSVYNANQANLFGTFTSLRQVLSNVGQSRPHVVLGGRIEF
jgi:hypothetical protein